MEEKKQQKQQKYIKYLKASCEIFNSNNILTEDEKKKSCKKIVELNKKIIEIYKNYYKLLENKMYNWFDTY
jgi:hypothetical protein